MGAVSETCGFVAFASAGFLPSDSNDRTWKPRAGPAEFFHNHHPLWNWSRMPGEFALAKFEDCLQRLEKIVEELEKGEVPLEKSLTLFEEGMQLSAACRKELDEAEGKVEILLKQGGKLQAEPFEPLLEKSPGRK